MLNRFEELEQLAGHGEHASLGLLVADLDHFKQINDEHGHPVGDAVLKDVAYAMRKALRAFDLVYRIGGEEFVVLLPGADLDARVEVGERLRAAVAEQRTGDVAVTMSLGVTAARGGGVRFADLYGAADAALYEASAPAATASARRAPRGSSRPERPQPCDQSRCAASMLFPSGSRTYAAYAPYSRGPGAPLSRYRRRARSRGTRRPRPATAPRTRCAPARSARRRRSARGSRSRGGAACRAAAARRAARARSRRSCGSPPGRRRAGARGTTNTTRDQSYSGADPSSRARPCNRLYWCRGRSAARCPVTVTDAASGRRPRVHSTRAHRRADRDHVGEVAAP